MLDAVSREEEDESNMAPEHDARTRAFYDHESDEPSPRRRRAAADWGVNEDIFDRMPSRRFARADRRAEHHDDFDGHRFERRVSGPSRPAGAWSDEAPRGEDTWGSEPQPLRRDDWADDHERRQIAPRRGDWPDRDEAPRRAADARGTTDEWAAPARADTRRDGAPGTRDEWAAPARAETRRDGARGTTDDFPAQRRTRRPAESWTVTDDHVPVEDGKRSIDSWLAPDAGQELALAPGESRTVVLETTPEAAVVTELAEPEFAEAPPVRRTVTITGHPDRLPAPRAQRPPKTALEHIGASPDRIVGYAVLLGFVLVLIAVLTTGQ
jgi:hypothetical protein